MGLITWGVGIFGGVFGSPVIRVSSWGVSSLIKWAEWKNENLERGRRRDAGTRRAVNIRVKR